MKKKPTIVELEAILAHEGEMSIELLPNGEIRAVETAADRLQNEVKRTIEQLRKLLNSPEEQIFCLASYMKGEIAALECVSDYFHGKRSCLEELGVVD